eukprot:m.56856 g.56856  ORF g.56856 m.56856 type:complete len:74 (-) comp11066_c0_seq1:3579-3800(-)
MLTKERKNNYYSKNTTINGKSEKAQRMESESKSREDNEEDVDLRFSEADLPCIDCPSLITAQKHPKFNLVKLA